MSQRIFLLIAFVGVFAGCATSKPNNQLMTHLQMRVGDLERQLELKDEQINDLHIEVKDLSYEIDRMRSHTRKREVSSRPSSKSDIKLSKDDKRIIRVNASPKSIQLALQKAGYYRGKIDSKIGSGTRTAISKFQKDHGLKVDGIIGRQTWDELKTYLD